MEKSVVLIDGENIARSWMRYCNLINSKDSLDYKKLIQKLSEGTSLLRAYFYDAVPEDDPHRKRLFLEALQEKGIQLRTKITKNRAYTCEHCNKQFVKKIQKGVDVSLATDILRHAWQNTCTICIVVSGDEDYKDAIECAKDKGIKIWVASFKDSLSLELKRSADRVIYIEDIFNKITWQKRNLFK